MFLNISKKILVLIGYLFFISYISFTSGCFEELPGKEEIVTIQPNYDLIRLIVTSDTLKFPLGEDMVLRTVSFNYLELNGHRYISFTDGIRYTITLYDFSNRVLVREIKIPRHDLNGKKIAQVTGWFKNFDSIYVSSYFNLYRIDYNGNILENIDFSSNKNSVINTTSLTNPAPPIFHGNTIYSPAYPYLHSNSKEDLKRWSVLCKTNFKTKTAQLLCKPPAIYQKNLYGSMLLRPYYCYNGNFIFSFPASSNIYVFNPDVSKYSNIYFGKSQYLPELIEPMSEQEISNGESTTRNSLQKNTYGPIYYDPYRRRYIRVAEVKITRSQYENKQWRKEQSVIVFDEDFKIIGESQIDKNINLYSLFITKEGVFARTDGVKDENNIYFVRLRYDK